MEQQQEDEERMLRPGQVAKKFGVDPKTLARWAKGGLIPSVRTPKGHRRYRESEVKKLLEGGRTVVVIR